MSYCDTCGNPKRNKVTDKCSEFCCYEYSRWMPDYSNASTKEDIVKINKESENTRANIEGSWW